MNIYLRISKSYFQETVTSLHCFQCLQKKLRNLVDDLSETVLISISRYVRTTFHFKVPRLVKQKEESHYSGLNRRLMTQNSDELISVELKLTIWTTRGE